MFRWLPALAIAIVFSTALADFHERTQSTNMDDGGLGVVFTGQFVRVRKGLELLQSDKLEGLFVSGVNSRAGMTIEGFANQFDLDDKLRSDLSEGILVLGSRADNTFSNANEARCWLLRNPTHLPIVLITSSDHMPRASLLLEFALDGRRVERISVFDDSSDFRDYAREFSKYLVAYAIACWQKLTGAYSVECSA
ncbi:YdcF family protein [Hoeflea sp. WL0058]|uniref:YdcF family protein n=1 Tax=Flavimaribacter sediminis TaxID=2865987 RepID=A0AAE3CZ16_9HYPH|nr:ElyC/SanA/YdcF family protein [Flavimaribacter sediminis]MBW8636189.1 YdcF family protein [Flavimaribacter sediminis]